MQSEQRSLRRATLGRLAGFAEFADEVGVSCGIELIRIPRIRQSGYRASAAVNLHSGVRQSTLPPFLQEVTITNLTVGSASLDVAFQRQDQDVGINIMRKEGDIEFVAIK